MVAAFATIALLFSPLSGGVANSASVSKSSATAADTAEKVDFQPLYDLCESAKTAYQAEVTAAAKADAEAKAKADTEANKNSGKTNCNCDESCKCKGHCQSDDGQCHCKDSTSIPARKTPPAFVRHNGYPLRSPLSYWTHKGVTSRSELIQHLQQGQHAGKFRPEWLATLSNDELESLHSDDHDHKLAVHYQDIPVNPSGPTLATDPPDVAIVDMDGKQAVYRLEVKSRAKRICDGQSCRIVQEKYVAPVFLGWQN
jgi:hypothetical protein